jgi:hypothetical protein
MFEPQLEHNRAEYTALNRKKWRALLLLLALAIPMVVLAMIFPEYVWHIVIALFVAMNAALGWFEVKMTMVFRRDLREQRERSE